MTEVRSSNPIVLTERISPRIRRSLTRNFRSFADAISELIDNAFDKFDGRVGGEVLEVKVDTGKRSVVVENRGGRGMGIEELDLWLNWGESDTGESADGIGEFGQGGKAALGFIGNAWTVRSKRWDQPTVCELREDEWNPESRHLKEYPVKQEVAPKELDGIGYFRLTISRLNPKPQRLDHLRNLLGSTYRVLLEERKSEILIDGKAVQPLVLPLYERVDVERFNVTTESGWRLNGWIGQLKSDARARSPIPKRGGIRLLRKGRLVCGEEFFGHPTPSYKQSLAKLTGEVDIPRAINVLPNKTDFDRSSRDWVEVQEAMYRVLKPHVLRLLAQPEDTLVTKEERARVRDVRDLMIRALREVDLPMSGGEGGVSETTSPTEPNPSPDPPKPPPPPRPLPPPRPRMKGMPEWSIRALDPTKRTDWEQSQNGSRRPRDTLLINKTFPLYRQRKGDELYIAESAALALARRPGFEDRTARDCLDEVDVIMTAICQIIGARSPAARS